MAADRIHVRPARREDRAAIAAWTRKTFHWGDYVAKVFDDWVRHRGGRLLIAELDGRAVGMLHVALLGEGESWMEGMRVHPKRRQSGIAAHLDAAGRDFAKRNGCRVARLETASDNLPAQAALKRFGYRRLVRCSGWLASGATEGTGGARPARRRDFPALWNLWLHSWIRRATRGIVPQASVWRWARLTPGRLRRAIVRGEAWVTPSSGAPRGFALTCADEGFAVALVVGRARAVGDLLRALRAAARQHGQKDCYLLLPDAPRAAAWAKSGGFRLESGSMLIYEQEL